MYKKITKKFNSFEEEERWLADLAEQNWLLISYDNNDVEKCSYKFLQDPNAKDYTYQIDYRDFNTKREYEDYKNLFKETGWNILSKNITYGKHIFISKTKNKIFSDQESMISRDINRYKSSLTYGIIFIIQALITGILYYNFDYPFLGAITIFGVFAAIYNFIDGVKRKKKIITMDIK